MASLNKKIINDLSGYLGKVEDGISTTEMEDFIAEGGVFVNNTKPIIYACNSNGVFEVGATDNSFVKDTIKVTQLDFIKVIAQDTEKTGSIKVSIPSIINGTSSIVS